MKTDWQPTATIETLKRRAQLMADVRLFFAECKVLEVDTPVLSHAAPTAAYLDSFSTNYLPTGGKAERCFLQTSPEFAMKRLLAVGSGDIFQIAKVFRNGEIGRLHSPEFTMLEWYRPQLSYQQLMAEVDALLQQVAGLPIATYFSYQALFEQYLQINPHTATENGLRDLAYRYIPSLAADWQCDKDGWLELIMSQYIEPKLVEINHPVIVYDFPASQAQLAKLHQDDSGQQCAARFEVYAGGLELANGYDECLSANELRTRFESDNQLRQKEGKTEMPIDEHLLAALEHGLPQCTGVALGLDRLLMLILKQNNINEVNTISFKRS